MQGAREIDSNNLLALLGRERIEVRVVASFLPSLALSRVRERESMSAIERNDRLRESG